MAILWLHASVPVLSQHLLHAARSFRASSSEAIAVASAPVNADKAALDLEKQAITDIIVKDQRGAKRGREPQ